MIYTIFIARLTHEVTMNNLTDQEKRCAELCFHLSNAKNEIDAAAKLCGKNKILADAVFAIGEQIKSVKKDAE